MQQRSPALQGKIRRMLKTTKSANKSVLADAVDENDTAYTVQGPEQPDEDDYGYTSNEASKLYRSIMDKYQSMPTEKKFSDVKKKERNTSELLSTKDRVREAILREREEEALGRKRGISSLTSPTSSARASDDPTIRHRSRKNLYDPIAEREEEERRKRDEEEDRRRARMQKRPPPPVMDFQKLLELAEKKQHEPIEVEAPPPKKAKETERLLTRKEKLELEERKAYMADRERRRQEALNPNKARRPEDVRSDTAKPVNKMLPNGRIPKLNSATTSQSKPASASSTSSSSSDIRKRPIEVPGRTPSVKTSTHTSSGSSALKMPSSKHDDRRPPSNGSSSVFKKPHPIPQKSMSSVPSNSIRNSSTSGSNVSRPSASSSSAIRPSNGHSSAKYPRDANRNEIKPSKDVRREPSKDSAKPRPAPSKEAKTREFPPKDLIKTRDFLPKDIKTREFPPKDIKTREFPPKDLKKETVQKTREFPPKDLVKTREFPPKDLKAREFPPKDLKTREFPPRDIQRRPQNAARKPGMHKRRILDDDDSEYDSEMDDFIDDDEGNDDYSKYIKEIFGYDKARYRHLDDDIDNMETTFAQQMREEQISRKIGLMEDLEDMRMEAEEMKRKAHRKKRRNAVSDDSD